MAISSAPDFRWEELRPGIWWGTYGDVHLGIIFETGSRFRTRDADDVWLGDYPTLETAQSILSRGGVPSRA